MSTANLLVYREDGRAEHLFDFDHAREHGALAAGMGASSIGTRAHYLLSPVTGFAQLAGMWATNHQVAHNDAAAYYSPQPDLILQDEEAGSAWWNFTNEREHSSLSEALLKRQGS